MKIFVALFFIILFSFGVVFLGLQTKTYDKRKKFFEINSTLLLIGFAVAVPMAMVFLILALWGFSWNGLLAGLVVGGIFSLMLSKKQNIPPDSSGVLMFGGKVLWDDSDTATVIGQGDILLGVGYTAVPVRTAYTVLNLKPLTFFIGSGDSKVGVRLLLGVPLQVFHPPRFVSIGPEEADEGVLGAVIKALTPKIEDFSFRGMGGSNTGGDIQQLDFDTVISSNVVLAIGDRTGIGILGLKLLEPPRFDNIHVQEAVDGILIASAKAQGLDAKLRVIRGALADTTLPEKIREKIADLLLVETATASGAGNTAIGVGGAGGGGIANIVTLAALMGGGIFGHDKN